MAGKQHVCCNIIFISKLSSTLNKSKIYAVENLRGIAALGVCIFHLTANQHLLHDDSLLKKIAGLGYLGVPIFFGISGFVIPWSLYKSNYHIKNFFSFLYKRFLRIEPPYLISIILLVVLNYASTLLPIYSGLPFQFSITQFLLHITFLPTYFNYPWYQPVYFTLLIEFQFYILCGLLFGVLASPKKWTTYSFLLGSLIVVYLLPVSLFSVFDTFLVGIIYFKYKTGHISIKEYWLMQLSIIIFTLITNPDKNIFATEILTAIGMMYWNSTNNVTAFFAKISYSLYLIHIPIGGRFINLSERYIDTIYLSNLFLVLAIALCIFCAWIFYKLVELPAIKLSRSLVKQF